jgi:uncharacterized membrane protein YkvA (DUF1232 family)
MCQDAANFPLAVNLCPSLQDLIPDFIPVLGILDDPILLPCLVWLAIHLIPYHIWAMLRRKLTQIPCFWAITGWQQCAQQPLVQQIAVMTNSCSTMSLSTFTFK